MSILDIISIALIDDNITYVGKIEISKIPLFGYMFKRLHIPVDRKDFRSRYNTIARSKEELDNGKNLVIIKLKNQKSKIIFVVKGAALIMSTEVRTCLFVVLLYVIFYFFFPF